MTASGNRAGAGDHRRPVILHNPVPDAIPPFYRTPLLFLQPRHLLSQPHQNLYYFGLLNETFGHTEAHGAFYRLNDWAISPSAASFGSIEFLPDLNDGELRCFLAYILERLKGEGLKGIRLVNYPDCYAPEQAVRLRRLFAEYGFRVVREMVNHHLSVNERPFADRLHLSERRRLKKCRSAGFWAGLWPQASPAEVYAILQQFRQYYQYPMALPEDRFDELMKGFPNEFVVFAVWDNAAVAALTVAVRVSDAILYNFFPASNPVYPHFSPSVMLTEALYDYCRREGLTMLDLGVSTDHLYQPKPGLIRFKARLGGVESLKTVYELEF